MRVTVGTKSNISRQHTELERRANHLLQSAGQGKLLLPLYSAPVKLFLEHQSNPSSRWMCRNDLVWQRVFRMVRGLEHTLLGKAEGAGLV